MKKQNYNERYYAQNLKAHERCVYAANANKLKAKHCTIQSLIKNLSFVQCRKQAWDYFYDSARNAHAREVILMNTKFTPLRLNPGYAPALVCFSERKQPITLPNDTIIHDLQLSIVREYRM